MLMMQFKSMIIMTKILELETEKCKNLLDAKVFWAKINNMHVTMELRTIIKEVIKSQAKVCGHCRINEAFCAMYLNDITYFPCIDISYIWKTLVWANHFIIIHLL